MPLDSSLNKDIHQSARLHVVMSRSGVEYGDKDPRLFSLATPKEVPRTYTRIFHAETGVVPKPDRIVHDVKKAVRAMAIIHGAKGAFVPGLAGGRVPGHRHRATEFETSNNLGSKRDKIDYDIDLRNDEMHADLISFIDEPEQDLTKMFKLIVD